MKNMASFQIKEKEEEEEEDHEELCPKVVLSSEERKQPCKPWRNGLIVQLLGQTISLKFLKLRLQMMWNHVGELGVIVLETTIIS